MHWKCNTCTPFLRDLQFYDMHIAISEFFDFDNLCISSIESQMSRKLTKDTRVYAHDEHMRYDNIMTIVDLRKAEKHWRLSRTSRFE